MSAVNDPEAYLRGEWSSVSSASGNHEAVKYEKDGERLFFQFRGGKVFQYLGVPEGVALALLDYSSAGEFIWDLIRVRGSKTEHRYPYVPM